MEQHEAADRLGGEHERLERVRRGLESGGVGDGETGELAPIDQHQADAASELFEREKQLSILGRVETDLADVSDALDRLEAGTYGVCQTCGAPIPDDRLEAVPATRFCLDHEVLWEGNRLSFEVEEDVHPYGGARDDRVAAREGAAHPEFLPTDDELDEELDLGPEERALHGIDVDHQPEGALSAAEVERLELRESQETES